jgi:acetyl esterase/lipase
VTPAGAFRARVVRERRLVVRGRLSTISIVVVVAIAVVTALTLGHHDSTSVPAGSCVPVVSRFVASPPPPGTDTNLFGARARAPYELAPPGGPRAGQAPYGVVFGIHGGGWVETGSGQLTIYRSELERWQARGWATVNADYRPCARSLGDVTQLYDLVRASVGPTTPICVTGQSVGGHLALLLAAERRDIACVESQAGIMDLEALGAQEAVPAPGIDPRAGPRKLAAAAAGAFGPGDDALQRASPVDRAAEITARTLLVAAATDPIVPPAQQDDMTGALKRAHPGQYVQSLRFAPGPSPFPHAGVATADLATLAVAETQLVAPWDSPAPAVPVHLAGWW